MTQQETQVLQDKLDQLRKKGSKDVETLKEMFEIQKKLNRARSEFMRREAQPALADTFTVEVTLAANAEPGLRELRVETPRGVSNPLAFYVGRLPEFREQEPEPTFEPRDFLQGLIRQPPRTETPITLPAVVNGQILPREPDMLYFRPSGSLPALPTATASRPARGSNWSSPQRRGNSSRTWPMRFRAGSRPRWRCTTPREKSWPTTTTTGSIPIPCCSSKSPKTDNT